MSKDEFYELNLNLDLKIESVKEEFFTEILITNLRSLIKELFEDLNDYSLIKNIKSKIISII